MLHFDGDVGQRVETAEQIKSAIIKVSILAAICDGDTIRGVKPEGRFTSEHPGSCQH
jgi:hypothetical protein